MVYGLDERLFMWALLNFSRATPSKFHDRRDGDPKWPRFIGH